MSNMNSEAVSSLSTDVAMFLYSFKDLIPVILHQWYLFHINRVVRLGLLEPYPWIITHISTPEFQNDFSFSADKQKKKSKKGDSAILATTTRVKISFAQYRIVICLDISESSFSCTSILTDTLLAVLVEISANTKENKRIIGVQLSVIAHMPEIDETWCIWQGEISSESDILLLKKLVCSRIERVEEQSFKAKAQAAQSAIRNYYRFPDSETYLKAILFHLRLLPGEACPKAILITSGSLTVKTGPTAVINQYSKELISLNVLVEQIPRDRPVGFYSDICGLELLSEQTVGGTVEVLHDSTPGAIDEVCKRLIGRNFFHYLAFGCKNSVEDVRNLNNQSNQSNPGIPKRISTSSEEISAPLNEKHGVHLKSYPCEGATVEHLLSVRHSEGFKIVDISYERENMLSIHATQSGPLSNPSLSRNGNVAVKKQPFLTFARQHSQQHQPSWEKAIAGEAVSQEELAKLFDKISENLSWSKGLLNISMRKLTLQDRQVVRNAYSYGVGAESKGEKAVASLVSSIFERDESISELLGGDYMPGSVAEPANFTDRVRTIPSSSSRYRLSRSTAQGSSGSLTSHLKSPSIASKGTSRFDDNSLSPLLDEIDSKNNDVTPGLRWLQSRYLVESLDLLEELCSLDKVLLFHLFLASSDVTEKSEKSAEKSGKEREKVKEYYDRKHDKNDRNDKNNEHGGHKKNKNIDSMQNRKLSAHILTMIFEGIAMNLPNPDMKRITPLKCIYIISNQNKIQAKNNISQVDFGILILELVQKDDVFLSFKISKLTKGCGQLSALVKIVVKSFFLTLKVCGLRAVKVKNDLSLSSMARTVSTFQRKMIDSCMSNGRSMSVLNIRRQPNLYLLMSELVQTKMSLGFQLLRGGNPSLPLLNIGSIENDERNLDSNNLNLECAAQGPCLVTHLCAVSSGSPLGIEMESLLQCEKQENMRNPLTSSVSDNSDSQIICSSEICTVDYYWPRHVHDLQYETASSLPYCALGAASSAAIEGAISACITRDQDIFRLYETAVPLMTSSESPTQHQNPFNPNPPFSSNSLISMKTKSKAFSLTSDDWQFLIDHAERETVLLPVFYNNSIKMSSNFLLLKMLGEDLSKYSARVINIISAQSDNILYNIKERRNSFITSKLSHDEELKDKIEKDKIEKDKNEKDKNEKDKNGNERNTNEKKLKYDDHMVISSGNCLIFIEFPDNAQQLLQDLNIDNVKNKNSDTGNNNDIKNNNNSNSNDSINSIDNINTSTISDFAVGRAVHHSASETLLLPNEPYYIDPIELESDDKEGKEDKDSVDDKVDKANDFTTSLSRSSSANSGYENLSPATPKTIKVRTPKTRNFDRLGDFNESTPSLEIIERNDRTERNQPTEHSKTCEIKLYCLELPTFRFADTALRSVVSQAVSSLSKSVESAVPRSAKSFLSGTSAIKENLKSFLQSSHMDNFSTVLCETMRKGEDVAPGDVVLGLERCCQSIYEVDISVMCRKRYLADLAAVGEEGGGPSVGSLCSAFEHTLGRLLKGLEEGNVFVLNGEVPIHGFASSDTKMKSGGNENLAVKTKYKSKSIDDSKMKSITPMETIGAIGIKASTSALNLPLTPVTTATPRVADDIDGNLYDRITYAGSMSLPADPEGATPPHRESPMKGKMGANTGVLPPKSIHKLDKTDNDDKPENNMAEPVLPLSPANFDVTTPPKGGAVFVRFAVVARLERPPSATVGAAHLGLGSSTSYQSLNSGIVGSSSSVQGHAPGMTMDDTPGGGQGQGASGLVHPLPCSSLALSHGLHSLCTTFGQVLESSSQSSVATTEIALRMIYIHSNENDGDYDAGSLRGNRSDNKVEKDIKLDSYSTKSDKSLPPKSSKMPNSGNSGNSGNIGNSSNIHNSSSHSLLTASKGYLFDKLSQEMRVFVASDTLNSLLVASSSNITAEILILVQHCLNDIPSLVQTVQSNLNFVCPASTITAKRPGDPWHPHSDGWTT